MKRLSKRASVALALSVPAFLAAAAGVVACSSSDSSTGGAPTSCSDQTLTIAFNPAYSAYTDGSREFDVPFVVDGVSSDAVHWNLADPKMGSIVPDTGTGGIQVKVAGSGSTTVIATAGSLCGSAPLNITASTEDQYSTGNDRYNNGISLMLGRGKGDDAPPDAGDTDSGTPGANGKTPACTNCHGANANSLFKDVAHTPEQTAGFSDDDLQSIFRNGTVPDGGYFDSSILPYRQWQQFHTWSMTDDEAVGIIVYLRALPPAAQDGTSNFGGHFNGDGGRHHGDGGGGGGGTGP